MWPSVCLPVCLYICLVSDMTKISHHYTWRHFYDAHWYTHTSRIYKYFTSTKYKINIFTVLRIQYEVENNKSTACNQSLWFILKDHRKTIPQYALPCRNVNCGVIYNTVDILSSYSPAVVPSMRLVVCVFMFIPVCLSVRRRVPLQSFSAL